MSHVIGGTINGGTAVDEIPCPYFVDDPERNALRFSPCLGEVSAEITDGGSLVLVDTKCPACDREFDDAAKETIKAAAVDAIDNYGGPNDRWAA
jgi:hypothetical protein